MSDSVESPDTLQSKQIAQIKDIWGAGPILGLVSLVDGTGLQSFALDYTRVQNPDGSFNWPDIQDPDFPSDPTKRIPSTLKIVFRNGDQDQEPVPGFEFEAATAGEGLRLRHDTPYVRTFANPNLDALRFDIRLPVLRSVGDGNKINGASVSFKFEVKYDAGSYTEYINDTIRGKASNPFVKSYQLDLDPAERPWASVTVRITRFTADSISVNLSNDSYIDSYTEIVDRKLSHPLHAYSATVFDARQFSSIPVRAAEVYGLLVDIPKNFNPWTREYATTGPGTTGGIWDGTFKRDWTCNPSWVCWYLLTDAENGLGIDPDDLGASKYEFYAAAKHCDELVDDGFGGQESRYECHTVIGGREDAYKVLSDFFGVMNAAPAYIGGQIVPIQDRYIPPEEFGDPFGPTNVENGEFTFSSTSRKQRHTVALVEWNDPADFGRPKTEYVEDQGGINDNGYNELHVTGIGITTRGRAHRKGRMMLLQEALRIDSVSFRTGLQGAAQRPGTVIPVMAPFRSGRNVTGRAKGGTVNHIDLDRAVLIEAGKTYSIMFTADDGTNMDVDIGNAPGAYTTLNFTAAIAHAPLAQGVWILNASDLVPELYSVFGVQLIDQLKSEITAIQYDPSIYAKVEGGVVLEYGPTSVLPDPTFCNSVRNILIDEAAGIDRGGEFIHRLVVKWDRPRVTLRSGPLQVGVTYTIDGYVAGDVFTNVGAASNANGVTFIATGTTPTNWTHASALLGADDPYVSEYAVKVRYNSGSWQPQPTTRAPIIDFDVFGFGFYDVEVTALGALGRRSVPMLAKYYLSPSNPLEGATVESLEIVNQGSTANFDTADVQFAWKISSPAIIASGISDPDGINSIIDPFYRGCVVRMYAVDGVTQIQDEVIVMDFRYDFTLEKNKNVARINIGADALPYHEFTIGVRILDRFKQLSAESKFTVHKLRPRALTNGNLVPTINGVNVGWHNPVDVSRKQVNIFMDIAPDTITAGYRVAVASGDTQRKSVDGIAGTGVRAFWVQAEDVFGLKSDLLFIGFVIPGQVNAVAEVTFDPDGGALPGATIPDNEVFLTHPDPEAKIFYLINITDADFPFSTVEDAFNHLYDIVGEIGINDEHATVTAAAFVRGIWGPPKTREYTRNAGTGGGGGGGGGGTDAAIAPTFDPPTGTYVTPDGTLDIAASTTTAADYVFYTHTTNGDPPATPTHDGSNNATGATIRVTGNALFLTLPRGVHKFKIIAVKAGIDDSIVAAAQYSVVKEAGGIDV